MISHPVRMRPASGWPAWTSPCMPRPPERSPCPGFCPLRVSSPVDFLSIPCPGTPGASQVLQRISSCMPRPEDSGGSPHPTRIMRMLHIGFGYVNALASRNNFISKLYQHFRVRVHPYGLQDSLCTLTPFSFAGYPTPLYGANTRYGWVASPYPAGTFTLQDTPSFVLAR